MIKKVGHALIRSLSHIPPADSTHLIIFWCPMSELFVPSVEVIHRGERRMKYIIAVGKRSNSYVLLFSIEVQTRIVWNLMNKLPQRKYESSPNVASGNRVFGFHNIWCKGQKRIWFFKYFTGFYLGVNKIFGVWRIRRLAINKLKPSGISTVKLFRVWRVVAFHQLNT